MLGLGIEAVQEMTNAMNAIANQLIRNSGRSTRNAVSPYFDGTYRDYPAFKKKFLSFQANYHHGTPSRELVQQFPEMCLLDKIALRIKRVESMEAAWVRLNVFYNDPMAFIKDLMQEIRTFSVI